MNRKLNLTKVSTQVSILAFVAVGLIGCSQDECDDMRNLQPQKKIDECKERKSLSQGHSTSSGFFVPIMTNTTSSGG